MKTNQESIQQHQAKLTVLMENHKTSFTKSENKVYSYILDHFSDVMYLSLTEIAMACETGESTVLRFCRKMGFKGYQDFKFALAQELATYQEPNKEESFVEKIKQNMQESLQNTSTLIDQQELENAIQALYHKNDVVVYGISSSAIAGQDMQNRLMRIGKNIEVVADPHLQITRAVSMNEQSLIVAISLTGSTKDIVDAVKQAKARGAEVIAITNYSNSPLTKYADHVLLTAAKENPLDSGSLVSKVSQLYVIDLLCTGLTMQDYERASKIKEMVAESISSKLY